MHVTPKVAAAIWAAYIMSGCTFRFVLETPAPPPNPLDTSVVHRLNATVACLPPEQQGCIDVMEQKEGER